MMKTDFKKKLALTTVILLVVFIVVNYAQTQDNTKNDLIKYVNPLIGTGETTTIGGLKFGGGNEHNAQVQPSVTVPFGMTNWTPQTNNTEKKCVAAYYYKDSTITGFRGSHWLSGSCTQEYGSAAIMPVFGKLVCNPNKRGSDFTHADEISAPDYYKVLLSNYGVIAEMSATARCGIFRFTFQNEGEAHLIFNPNSDEGEGSIRVIPGKSEINGSNPVRRIYQGSGKTAGFSGHFVVKIEKKLEGYGTFSNDEIFKNEKSIENKPNSGAYVSFKVKKGEQIIVKVGTSFVGIDEAEKNLENEIPGYDFELVRNNLNKQWNNLLSKITVEGDDKNDKVKFYTAVYHSFQQPRIYNDFDGTYPRFDGNAATDTIKIGNYYCDFSVWDTYRALHPLFNILIPEQQSDMIRSLLVMGKAGGWLPIFPQWNSYTSAMIGDHVIALVAESYVKDVIDLSEEDYNLLKHNANETPSTFTEYADGKGRRALTSYLKYGYIPLEDSVKEAFHKNEQVSRTLEYAYDDYALAQIAKKMGKKNDYEYYLKRSQNYSNVYDPSVKNMNGRYTDGTFTKDFGKERFMSFITEGTPWQYNWYVPQDVNGLIELMGGKKEFNKNLDSFFAADQYWHGNEPGHQIPFLYDFSDQPWKTQKIVADVMREEYGIGPGGLSGNDDAGQISAWYIFGAIGFYPVCPVNQEYQICGPKFSKITIKLGNGKDLVINAPDYSHKNIFIKKMMFNGKDYKSYSISHELLMQGGEWNYKMVDRPVN